MLASPLVPRPEGVTPRSPGQTPPPGYIHLGRGQGDRADAARFRPRSDPVIREAGLDPSLFDDGANVIPHAALGRLLTLCVARTNCPHFGLLVGRRGDDPVARHGRVA